MSELRVGLAVEGPTDALVLEAGLSSFLAHPFIAVTLQPEMPPGGTGAGWAGVFSWCRQMGSQGYPTLMDSPTLGHLDLVIIQIDADVGKMTYDSGRIEDQPYYDLPCECPCPPASDTVDALYNVVCGWLTPVRLGGNAVVCIPSKSIEAWVAAALYVPSDPGLGHDLECSYDVITYMLAMPARERLIRMKGGHPRKIKPRFKNAQQLIKDRWDSVCKICPQAERFQVAVEKEVGEML